MSTQSSRRHLFFALSLVLLPAAPVLLTGCDLARNHTKIDRTGNLEFQDYRDALASRQTQAQDMDLDFDSDIPEFQPYVANPDEGARAMPLVSLAVNQTVPVRDVLFELAEQAEYDIELDPRIRGSIIFTARNRPLDKVVDHIAEVAGLRYSFEDEILRVELDTPYHETYQINYLSYVRSSTSSISNDVAVVSGGGTDTGSQYETTAESESDFWGELEENITQILGANRDAGTLKTQNDPRITATESNPAPVEPLVIDENGEIIEAPASETQAPEAILRVESLPVDGEGDSGASGDGPDPFEARFSINKQGGMISVFAPERAHKQVSSYLEQLERAVTSQVLIEAKVLEVTLSDEYAAGINWNAINLLSGEATLNFARSFTSPGASFSPNATAANFQLGFTGNDITAVVDAVSRFGTVHALASPRLTVLNNQSAVLNVAENIVYFEVDIDVTVDNGVSQTEIDSEIRNVPEGVLINVQPSIDLETGKVAMAVRPTVTRVDRFEADPAVSFVVAEAASDPALSDAAREQLLSITSQVPVVNVQEMDSVLQVDSGQAIVMGGLMQDRTTSEQNATPVLGELPLLGGLFRDQSDNISKTELVIFMKATIIDGGNSVYATDKDLYRQFAHDRRPLNL